jgi:hypothetical protein
VPVRRAAAAAAIAATAGVGVDVAAAALAALASAGLVEQVEGAWAMTHAGRADRKARRQPAAGELPFDWW